MKLKRGEAVNVAAIDPGRDKCGLAVLDDNYKVLAQVVVPTVWLADEVRTIVEKFAPQILLMGNGTTSKNAKQRIEEAIPELPIKMVDEYKTTEAAKTAYWEANPPKGWRRFFPISMQVPPVPVDDFVAVILARRYLMNLQFS